MIDKNKLKRLLKEKKLKIRDLADMLGLSYAGCYKKVEGTRVFTIGEIVVILKLLNVGLLDLWKEEE